MERRFDESFSVRASGGAMLPQADLPTRLSTLDLVQRAIVEEGATLRVQIAEAAAPIIVTLGQEAADVLCALASVDRVLLVAEEGYGSARPVTIAGREMRWIPLVHPGNRSDHWRHQHRQWKQAVEAGL
jgi:uracil-DNA glycosylase